MLRAVVEKNNKKAYIDFNSSWDKIHNSLNRIGIEKNIVQLKFSDSDIKIHFTQDSGGFYKQLKHLINGDDTFFMAYNSCKIFQNCDKELLNYLQNKFDSQEIKKVSDIDTAEMIYKLYKAGYDQKKHWSFDANVLNYELINIFNYPVIFNPSRIDRRTLPKGIYCYEVQHDDNHRGNMTMLGKHITVNFWGTVISSKKICLEKNGYRHIDEEKDVVYLDTSTITLKNYIDNYCKKNQKINIQR